MLAESLVSPPGLCGHAVDLGRTLPESSFVIMFRCSHHANGSTSSVRYDF